MGVRLNKSVGYGFQNVESKECDLTDDRFDPEGIMFNEDSYTLQGYYDYLKKESERLDPIDAWDHKFEAQYVHKMIREESKFSFDLCFIWRGEYGLPNVFLSIPISQTKSWHRNNDVLDYVEENNNKKPYRSNYFRLLGHGIHPWTASYCDKRDGRELYYQRVNAFQRIIDNNIDIDQKKLKEILGFDSLEEARENIQPSIPKCLENLIKYCRVFKEDKSILELQPMSYTYWA